MRAHCKFIAYGLVMDPVYLAIYAWRDPWSFLDRIIHDMDDMEAACLLHFYLFVLCLSYSFHQTYDGADVKTFDVTAVLDRRRIQAKEFFEPPLSHMYMFFLYA
ncbi:hypothetical protein BDN70DRAFT_896740 [Pholiota conissans]|uniref:Uncharacterized protein n=1 Tax=Pholiota conissans TaxID=109636 RepID=A0A9P5YWM4_9AGAR|nr:hypothetical protein BDN70DRAFT_896740 [Pholiota conissans]